MSQGQIMAYQAPKAAIQGIVEALEAAHVYYGIKQAKAISDHLSESQDPKSEYSQSQQKYESAVLDFLHEQKGTNGKPVLNDQNYQALKQEVPKHSGQDIAQFTDSGGLLKLSLGDMGAQAQVNRMGVLAAPRTQQQIIALNNQFENNPVIQQSNQLDAQAKKDLDTIANRKVMDPQTFNELQKGLANMVAGGANSSVTTENRQMLETVQSKVTDLAQRVLNKKIDVNSPEVVGALKDGFFQLQLAARKNRLDMAKQLSPTLNPTGDPSYQKVIDGKLEFYGNSVASHPYFGKNVDAMAQAGSNQTDTGSSGFSPMPGSNAEAGDMVDVVSPQGIPGRIPKTNLDKATQRGFKVR